MDHESILPNMESKEDKYFSVCELHFKWGGKKKKKKNPTNSTMTVSPGCWGLDTHHIGFVQNTSGFA